MAQVYVKYNPYKMETQVKVNGKEVSSDSILYKVVKKKRLQEWVGKFPEMLKDELNENKFDVEFYGMPLDMTILKMLLSRQSRKKLSVISI